MPILTGTIRDVVAPSGGNTEIADFIGAANVNSSKDAMGIAYSIQDTPATLGTVTTSYKNSTTTHGSVSIAIPPA